MNLFYYHGHQETYESSFPTSKRFRPFWDKVKHGVSVVSQHLLEAVMHFLITNTSAGSLEQPLHIELSATVFSKLGKS